MKKQRHGMSGTPTYKSWKNMIRRCTRPNHINKKDYKDRGISVCDRWRSFINFYQDMGDRPPGYSLDRIDNNGNYTPKNCRWATKRQQDNNKRTNVFISHQGETLTLSQWSRKTGIHVRTLSNRYNRAPDRDWDSVRVSP